MQRLFSLHPFDYGRLNLIFTLANHSLNQGLFLRGLLFGWCVETHARVGNEHQAPLRVFESLVYANQLVVVIKSRFLDLLGQKMHFRLAKMEESILEVVLGQLRELSQMTDRKRRSLLLVKLEQNGSLGDIDLKQVELLRKKRLQIYVAVLELPFKDSVCIFSRVEILEFYAASL